MEKDNDKTKDQLIQELDNLRRENEALSKKCEDLQVKTNEIVEASTPIVQVWESILVVPIIGTLDSDRTQRIMENVLNEISDTNSLVALLDITGVPSIDSVTAQHIIETVTAIRLLGSKVVITGIKPQIAQTLVHIGISLSEIRTTKSLADGLEHALNILGLQITKKGT